MPVALRIDIAQCWGYIGQVQYTKASFVSQESKGRTYPLRGA